MGLEHAASCVTVAANSANASGTQAKRKGQPQQDVQDSNHSVSNSDLK
jgi:hypothetical protein